MENFIKRFSELVEGQYSIDFEEDEYGVIEQGTVKDSFGEIDLTVSCEPEDANWDRDLQDNFYDGVRVGVRNTLKVLKDNPELIKELQEQLN